MYNKQLDTFISVVEKGSFAKAGSAGYISSSAVIQQINHLENNLQVKLLIRKKSGIQLTEAGRYLYQRAKEIVEQDRVIRENLRKLASPVQTISIGTSLTHKVRLLYEIWMLYTQDHPNQSIRMVNLIPHQGISPDVDLIETIKDASGWQQNWNFLKICDVHVACALSRIHPLASKEMLTCDDIRPYSVLGLKREHSSEFTALYNSLKEKDIFPEYAPDFEAANIWETSVHNHIMLVPDCWQDILVDLKLIPFSTQVTLPYGLFYRPDAPEHIRSLLTFTEKLYQGKGSAHVVPVFS